MTNIAGASSGSSSGCVRREIVFGIPKQCSCGASITSKISKSAKNPYRHYYRCCYADSLKLVDDEHSFKWVDEAIVNELEKLSNFVELEKVEMEFQNLQTNIENEMLDEVAILIGDSEWKMKKLMVDVIVLASIVFIGVMKILN